MIAMLAMVSPLINGQNLQIHYDFRHTVDPKLKPTNFPTFTFEYFKEIDTLGTGSFLFKTQIDLRGEDHNVGQVFTQVSQSLRFWKPKFFIYLNYSGGLGMTSDGFGFYLSNAFGAGVSYPFQWRGAWVATNLSLRYTAFKRTSYDPQFVFYFGRGFLNYRILISGSYVFWTENRDQGIEYTAGQRGKKFAFFGDPQVWIKIKGGFSIGSRVNVFYHLLTNENQLQFYPTIGGKCQF